MAALGIHDTGAVVVTAAEGWHPGVRRSRRGAAEGTLRPSGVCNCAGAGRVRHRVGPLDRRRRSRPRGAPRGYRRLAGQGRRSRHGGGRHARRKARSRNFAPISKRRSAPPSNSRAATTRCASMARCRRPARRLNFIQHDRARRAVRRRQSRAGAGVSRASGRYAEEVGQAHVRVRLKAGEGAPLNAIAFRAVGTKARRGVARRARRSAACRGIAGDRPLAGRGARAVAHHRCGGADGYSQP